MPTLIKKFLFLVFVGPFHWIKKTYQAKRFEWEKNRRLREEKQRKLLELIAQQEERDRIELQKQVAEQIEKEKKLMAERAKERIEELFGKYPRKEITESELKALPRPDSKEFLYTCPFGTWFVCRPHPEFPQVVIIGQVVAGKDLDVYQWGSGLSIPERGINRYRAVIV